MKKVLSIFIVILCFYNNAIAQGKLAFTTKDIDLGTVTSAEPIRCSYTFKNIGNAPIEIASINPTSAMIKSTYTQGKIMPNEEGTIDIRWDIYRQSSGSFKKLILLRTSNETIKLYLSGNLSDAIPEKQWRGGWYRTYKDGKYGALDANGKVILPQDFSKLYNEADGFVAKKGNRWYYFTQTGSTVFSVECDDFEPVTGGFIVQKNKTYSYYDYKGKIVFSCDFIYETHAKDGFYCKKNGVEAFFDNAGNCIIPYSRGYTSLYKENYFPCTYFKAKKGNLNVLCNKKGEEVFFFEMKKECIDVTPYYAIGRFVVVVKTQEDSDSSSYSFDIHDYKGNWVVGYKGGCYDSPIISINGNILENHSRQIVGNIKKAATCKNPLE